ncbi:unnamed protein product, partial [Darwinula stevensoni]
VGDQILEVNSKSFIGLSHDEAVSHLKSWDNMTMYLRHVGRVPHSAADNTWSSNPSRDDEAGDGGKKEPVIRSPTRQSKGAEFEMIREKARCVLSHTEHARLDYYCQEYAAGSMAVDAFIAVLLELLNSEEKVSEGRLPG